VELIKHGGREEQRQADPVELVSDHFSGLGYSVRKVDSAAEVYDLLAQKAGDSIMLKVIDAGEPDGAYKLTPTEYGQMLANAATYIVCLVTQGVDGKDEISIFQYLHGHDAWIDERGRTLRIEEEVRANLRVEG